MRRATLAARKTLAPAFPELTETGHGNDDTEAVGTDETDHIGGAGMDMPAYIDKPDVIEDADLSGDDDTLSDGASEDGVIHSTDQDRPGVDSDTDICSVCDKQAPDLYLSLLAQLNPSSARLKDNPSFTRGA